VCVCVRYVVALQQCFYMKKNPHDNIYILWSAAAARRVTGAGAGPATFSTVVFPADI